MSTMGRSSAVSPPKPSIDAISRRGAAAVDNHHGNGGYLQFERTEAVTRCVAHPRQATIVMIESGAAGQIVTLLAGSQIGIHTHDIRLLGSDGEYPLAPATHDDSGRRRRARLTAGTVHRVVLAGECCLIVVPQRLHDREAFGEPVHPRCGIVVADTRFRVVTAEPTRTKTNFYPAFRRQSESGEFLGENNRVAQVIVQHQRPHT